ncbi:MAG: flagellar hook-length control protein FliK [Pseudomonadota bacterium]
MLPADLLAATLNRLATTDRPLISANPDRQNAQPPAKLEIGQQIQATVQAKVAADQFQVKVGNQTMQMQLPAFIRPGDKVTLQVVSLQPRLTFSLAASTTPLSTAEQLGSTARLLSSLSQQPVRQDYAPAVQREPLWIGERSAPDTQQLASRLHQSLSHSGLFYEAHQAQWIAGTRSTPQLMQEPHNLLRAQLPPASAADAGLATVASQASASAGETPRLPHIPEHLQPIVQQQLQALEHKQVVWQGQAWQGQEMRWEVRDETPRQGERADAQRQWVTELHLDLPHLGAVSARLHMNGDAVSLTLETDEAQSARTLEQASAQLVDALGARGIPVLKAQVARKSDTQP